MKRQRHRGSVTVFFCILLSILIPLAGILTDLVRYRLACGQVREALRLTADSLLAGYDRPLREEYGLFSMAMTNRAGLDEKAADLLMANLTPMDLEGVSDLYGFQLERFQAIPLQNLSESAVLEQQVAEFMKYRAPMQMVSGLLEKLKAFSGAAGETAVIQADMSLDRELAVIRSDLVHLALLRVRMETIGSEPGQGITNLREKLDRNMTSRSDAVRVSANEYRKLADAMNLLLPDLRASALRCASASISAGEAERNADAADKAVKTAETAWEKAKDKSAEKARLAEGLAAFKAEANAKRLSASILRQDATAVSAEMEQMKTSKWKPLVEQAAVELENVSANLAANLADILQLEAHLSRHRIYLEKGVELSESLAGKLDELTSGILASGAMAQNMDGKAGSTSGTLKAALAKQPDLPDGASARKTTGIMKTALGNLSAWSAATAALKTGTESWLRNAESAAVGFGSVSSDPPGGTGNLPNLFVFHSSEEQGAYGLSSLGQFSSYEEMKRKGTMVLPDFTVNPFPSEVERDEFKEWFSEWSGETGDTSGTDVMDTTAKEKQAARKTLGSLRNSAGETARNIQAGDVPANGRTAVFTADEALLLPSGPQGKADSSSALSEIGTSMLSTEAWMQYVLPLADGNAGDTKINEKSANYFTRGLDRVSETANQLGTAMAEAPESFMKSLYLNEYILSAFKNATTPDEGIPQEIGWGRNPEDTAFSKGEAEYVLFGSPTETNNLAAMKRSLFATRMAMNLLHVYTTPAKESATLVLATALAGWTVFGIPVVQNFLMISWAAAESCVDLDRLCKGEAVPLVKTTSSWYLDPGSVKEELVQKLLLNPMKQQVSKTVGNGLNRADEAVQETVGGWIDAGVDEVFAPLEIKCLDFGKAASEAVLTETAVLPEAVSDTVSLLLQQLPVSETEGPLLNRFEGILSLWMDTLRKTCAETVKLESARQVEALRERVKVEIRARIFQSSFYNALVTQARKTATDLVDAGFDTIGKQADNLFGKGTGITGLKAGIAGRMMTMDYSEYIAMYLLLVPEAVKTSRVADLVQLNLNRMVPDAAKPMKERNTAVYLRAEVSMDFWFLPDRLVKKSGFGLIRAEWGQGY